MYLKRVHNAVEPQEAANASAVGIKANNHGAILSGQVPLALKGGGVMCGPYSGSSADAKMIAG
jgi:hypothetical protein